MEPHIIPIRVDATHPNKFGLTTQPKDSVDLSDAANFPVLLTMRQVAKIFHVTDRTVARWADTRQLRHIILPGGAKRFMLQDIQAILNPIDPIERSDTRCVASDVPNLPSDG